MVAFAHIFVDTEIHTHHTHHTHTHSEDAFVVQCMTKNAEECLRRITMFTTGYQRRLQWQAGNI